MRKEFKDITGQRFGRLTAIKRIEGKKPTYWLCECDCGNRKEIQLNNLTTGNSKSCGCLSKEHHVIKHNASNTRLYNIYLAIKNRCLLKSCSNYKRYGGRGIKVCREWIDNFENFREWSISNGYNDQLSIDRIDNNGNYCPENCRWTTVKEQANNRRSNVILTYNGISQTIMQWSEEINIPYMTLRARIERGWSVQKALTTPVLSH